MARSDEPRMALIVHLDVEFLDVSFRVCDWCENRAWLIDKNRVCKMMACFDHAWELVAADPDAPEWH